MKAASSFLLLFVLVFSACKKDKDSSIIVYQDSLKTDNLTWPTDSNNSTVTKFDQGHLSFFANNIGFNNRMVAPFDSIGFPYSLQVDVTIHPTDINGLGGAGLLFNYIDADNFNAFEVFTDGSYKLWEKHNAVVNSLEQNINIAIKTAPGSTNAIKVIQSTTTVEVRVNNTTFTTYSVPILSSNCRAGLVVTTNTTQVTALYNNFIISKL